MADRDESGLHRVHLSLEGRALLDSPNLVLLNRRDRQTLFELFQQRRPEVVFHAAALKHLPLLEQYPGGGGADQRVGNRHLLEAAAEAGVDHFVNISTDKAADPVSVPLSGRVRLPAQHKEHERREAHGDVDGSSA